MIKFVAPLSRKATFFIGVTVGILLLYLLLLRSADKLIDQQNSTYGQSLANAAARESVEDLFHQDLVSMRANLQSVVDNPGVLTATIYDVENNLVVQAGKSQPEGIDFSAPITIHESLAGYVTIKLNPETWPAGRPMQLVQIIVFSCIALAALFIYMSKSIQWEGIALPDKWRFLARPPNAGTEDDITQDENEPHSEANEISVRNKAYVALCIKNIGTLQQQLNGSAFRNTFNLVEEMIEAIMHLYGADDWRWHNDRYLIEFQTEGENNQALFNAACAAQLMLDLCGIINRVPLDLSAQIALHRNDLTETAMPFVGLAVDRLAADADCLKPKVEYLDLGEEAPSRLLIKHFVGPYNDLLQKQMEQIRPV